MGARRTITPKPLIPAGDFSVAGGANGKLLAAGLLLMLTVSAALGGWFLPDS
jgi:hypothetical protein